MAASTGEAAPPTLGIVDSIRLCVATWVSLLKTRVEIISTELEEERERLEEIVLLAVASIFLLSLGVILLTMFVVMLFWESYRLQVLGGFALLYLGGGIYAAFSIRKRMKAKPKLFSTTMAELVKDAETLAPKSAS